LHEFDAQRTQGLRVYSRIRRRKRRRDNCRCYLIGLVCKKLKNGKSISVIASEVEQTVEVIAPICKVAEKYAPGYDVDAIYDELNPVK
jgi:hypothetical protein